MLGFLRASRFRRSSSDGIFLKRVAELRSCGDFIFEFLGKAESR